MDGCSADWPARKWAAEAVRMRRIERRGRWARAVIIVGILIVATEPEAQRSRCDLPSWRCWERSDGAEFEVVAMVDVNYYVILLMFNAIGVIENREIPMSLFDSEFGEIVDK